MGEDDKGFKTRERRDRHVRGDKEANRIFVKEKGRQEGRARHIYKARQVYRCFFFLKDGGIG